MAPGGGQRTHPKTHGGVYHGAHCNGMGPCLHWLRASCGTGPSGRAGASGPDTPKEGQGQWTWPESATEWHIILKADVTKAHRRVKIHSRDWRFQVAQIGDEWWVNKVGTYGTASAQLYWGRMAALLLRIVYAVFPAIDWGFVFVDDFAWLLQGHLANLHSTVELEEDGPRPHEHVAWIRH